MSRTLYLVRLRQTFRVRETDDGRVQRLTSQALFASPEVAEQFTQIIVPIENNPFSRGMEWFVDEEESCINFLEEHYYWERELEWFLKRIHDVGMSSPDEFGWDLWCWWKTITKDLKESDCLRLRSWLELPGDHLLKAAQSQPYHIVHVGKVILIYYISLDTLKQFLLTWGLELPDMPSGEKNWEIWWDENAPHMTDDQKATLWRLLDPQPWEIIEVELESGR